MIPKIRVSLTRRNASKRERLVTGFVIISAMVFLWIEETSGAFLPNLTTVETWGETQIKVTWQPFEHVDSNKPHFYELYIDDHLEYFGNDVIYIARRLNPDTMYHFKLRSCIQGSKICSPFSKTLSGTTALSRKRGLTKSFLQWTFFCLAITVLASSAAFLGAKISKRLWRSFLYRYDYSSETNILLPKCVATTDGVEEDLVSLFSFKTKTEDARQCNKREEGCVNDCARKNESSFKDEMLTDEINMYSERKIVESTEPTCDTHVSNVETNCIPFEKCESKDIVDFDESFYCKEKGTLNDNSTKHATDTNLSIGKTIYDFLNIHKMNDSHLKDDEAKGKTERIENLTLQRAHTSPKLKYTKDSKRKHKGHSRTLSFDDNIQYQHETFKLPSPKTTKRNTIPQNTEISNKHSSDLVIVVDNSNIFIGAQECSTIVNPHERKRNIRVKIQQLVKVFQKGRVVCRAFVQGSSPPTTEQVWEVYRRLGYCVDVEERRGKDEQRVDEGLHLHIYKALFELSPRTLVIASGDGNKGKSECATSLPGCAEAAIRKGWKVEIHSWQHSTSTEWIKLSKKYSQLNIHYLDRFLNHITFVDGKYGRKCQPFPADVFRYSIEDTNSSKQVGQGNIWNCVDFV